MIEAEKPLEKPFPTDLLRFENGLLATGDTKLSSLLPLLLLFVLLDSPEAFCDVTSGSVRLRVDRITLGESRLKAEALESVFEVVLLALPGLKVARTELEPLLLRPVTTPVDVFAGATEAGVVVVGELFSSIIKVLLLKRSSTDFLFVLFTSFSDVIKLLFESFGAGAASELLLTNKIVLGRASPLPTLGAGAAVFELSSGCDFALMNTVLGREGRAGLGSAIGFRGGRSTDEARLKESLVFKSVVFDVGATSVGDRFCSCLTSVVSDVVLTVVVVVVVAAVAVGVVGVVDELADFDAGAASSVFVLCEFWNLRNILDNSLPGVADADAGVASSLASASHGVDAADLLVLSSDSGCGALLSAIERGRDALTPNDVLLLVVGAVVSSLCTNEAGECVMRRWSRSTSFVTDFLRMTTPLVEIGGAVSDATSPFSELLMTLSDSDFERLLRLAATGASSFASTGSDVGGESSGSTTLS